MTKQQFNFEFVDKKHGLPSFELAENIRVYRQPLELVNEQTYESIKFKNIDELLNYKIDGVTVWDIIESKDTLCPNEIVFN